MLQHLARGTAVQAQKLATRLDSSSDLGIGTSLKMAEKKCKKSIFDSLPHVGIGTFAKTCDQIIAAFLSVIRFNTASVRGKRQDKKARRQLFGSLHGPAGSQMEMVCRVVGSPNGTLVPQDEPN